MRATLASALLLLLTPLLAGCQTAPVPVEEFVGPLSGWADAKADYGAVGDGRADDTAALQRAFDDLGREGKASVLYLPAGTYRLTSTLVMAERIGISIYGEHPDRTILRWDGPEEGTMAWFNGVAYSAFARITWDGAGRALTAVDHGWEGNRPHACTHNEHADQVFQDVGFGIRGGSRGYMDAETSVLRCRFLRCSRAGLSIENFNALDWFVWDSLFEDCQIGVTNRYGAGNFCVYQSVFRRSREADFAIGNLCYFSVRDCYSEGSKAFFVGSPFSSGALITLQGNTVVDPEDAAPIRIANLGPVILMDNLIRSRAGVTQGPVVQIGHPNGQADLFSIGNRFTAQAPLHCYGRMTSLDDEIVARGQIAAQEPALPGTAPNLGRRVIEVPSGSGAQALQAAIDQAAQLTGQRPVIHLPQGNYPIDRTLVIPAGADMQLIGDALIYKTRLQWTGEGEGPLLKLEGPSRATLRHLHLHGANRADGLVVTNCDQPGGRLYVWGASVPNAEEIGVLVDGVEQADVSMHDFYHAGAPVSFQVLGGPRRAAGEDTPGRVCVFSGATSNNQLTWHVDNGGRLLAQDVWYETNDWPRFIHLTGNGELYYQGGMVATSGKPENRAAVELDGLRGKLALLSGLIHSVSRAKANLVLRGGSPEMQALFLGCQSNDGVLDDSEDPFFVNQAPEAQVLLLHNRRMDPPGAAYPLPDSGPADEDFLREMLKVLRAERPRPLTPLAAGLTDARLYRLFVESCRTGIRLQAAP